MIAIKGMEMPSCCAECKFCINQKTNDYGSYGQCVAHNCETVNTLNWSLPPSCPLVEIVTCKDCIHRDKYGCRHGHPNCKDNFWCADAERRE